MAFRLRVLLILIGAILTVAPGRAAVLDWSTLTWTAGSLSNSYDIDPNSAGNDITVTISGDTPELTTDPINGIATPTINTDQAGGLSPAPLGLNIAMNSGKQDRLITVTVSFSAQYALTLSTVSFSLFGIDRPGAAVNYIDQVSLISATAIDGVTAVAPTITSLGSSVTLTGTGVNQVLTANNSSPRAGAGSGNGNATITFNAPIKSFTFSFGDDNPAFNNPDPQDFSLANIAIVPEPNSFVVAAVVCGAAILSRRRTVQTQSRT
jgi:hypothetical protein